MKIAIVNAIRPSSGSGSGITEYAYQLITHLKPLLSKQDTLDEIYAINESRYNNIRGLILANTTFKCRLAQISKSKFDIIHITDHELGFAAKILKKSGTTAKIITTIHDLSRFEGTLHKGIAQKTYNKLVRGSIRDAILYSDLLLCNSTQTYYTIRKRFPQVKNIIIVPHGIDDSFFTVKKETKKNNEEKFIIGYLGSLAYHKNVIFLLHAADILKYNSEYEFQIYGTGTESQHLKQFKEKHHLNNVLLMGIAQQRNKVKIYDTFDVFVFPSLYEGLGYPILEAQQRKIPVVIRKESHITKEVRGYCLQSKTPEQLANLLKNFQIPCVK